MPRVLVVGGGHNGLVAAAYLARAGRDVTVLERRGLTGGCSVTEELWPGYQVSTAAFVTSMFEPKIIEDLELKSHGFEMIPRDPSSFTPFLDGRSLTLWSNMEKSREEIAKFSRHDADVYPKYSAWLSERAAVMEPLLYETPPSLPPRSLGDYWDMAMLGLRHRRALPYLQDIAELQTKSAAELVDRWFESGELKSTLAAEGLLGAWAGPRGPCTAFLLMHVALGSTGGGRGVWAYPRGGMGSVARAIASAAVEKGAKIRTGCAVEKILVSDGRTTGVRLTGGEEIQADTILSNADPHNTFVRMVGEQHLPDEFNARMKEIDYSCAALKINLGLSGLPEFTAAAGSPEKLRGSIHIIGTIDDVERAFDQAKYGHPSEQPTLHCTIPSLLDGTLAPKDKHVMNVFAQYAPYRLADGLDWDVMGAKFAERCIARLEQYAPNIRGLIEHQQVLTPLDMERTFGLHRGNIFHGAMTATQMFAFRPAAGWARYRTPVRGLYLCGAGAHPGGGVTGIPGYNAARAVIADRA